MEIRCPIKVSQEQSRAQNVSFQNLFCPSCREAAVYSFQVSCGQQTLFLFTMEIDFNEKN